MALETPRGKAGSPEAEETPTVCGEDLSQSPLIALESSKDTPPPTLKERMPAPSRVLAEVTKNHTIQFLLCASKFFNNGKRILLEDALWQRVNDRIHDALEKCAATSQKDIGKMSEMYLKETQDIINDFASKLYDHLPPDQKITNKEDIVNASLLLQSTSVEYVEILHELISYSLQREKLTINEQVAKRCPARALSQPFGCFLFQAFKRTSTTSIASWVTRGGRRPIDGQRTAGRGRA